MYQAGGFLNYWERPNILGTPRCASNVRRQASIEDSRHTHRAILCRSSVYDD